MLCAKTACYKSDFLGWQLENPGTNSEEQSHGTRKYVPKVIKSLGLAFLMDCNLPPFADPKPFDAMQQQIGDAQSAKPAIKCTDTSIFV